MFPIPLNGSKRSAEKRASMTPHRVRGKLWAQRLKRVFNIDIETCDECGGEVKIIASIEDPVVIKKILDHLERNVPAQQTVRLPENRAAAPTGLMA